MFQAFESIDAPFDPVDLSFDLLDRHLLVVGQSGSGKSYFLGRCVEELALKTAARVVIFDRAGDFVKLAVSSDGNELSGIRAQVHSRWDAKGPESETFHEPGVHPSWFDPLDLCAALGLPAVPDNWQPIAAAQRFVRKASHEPYNLSVLIQSLQECNVPAAHIISRLDGMDELTEGLFTRFRPSNSGADVTDTAGCIVKGCLDPQPRLRLSEVHVVDVSKLKAEHSRNILFLSALRAMWQSAKRQWYQRHLSGIPHKRTPFFLVVDEAHHLCPRETPDGTLAERVREALVEVATEGRKYGLWLVIGTQRPTRLHPSVLSESSNFLLMRTTAPAELKCLQDITGIGDDEFPDLAKLPRKGGPSRKGGPCYLAGEWSDGKLMKVKVSGRVSVHPEGNFALDEWV